MPHLFFLFFTCFDICAWLFFQKTRNPEMIAEKPSWIRHEGMQIFSIDIQPGGLRFATGGGDHKVTVFSQSSRSLVHLHSVPES